MSLMADRPGFGPEQLVDRVVAAAKLAWEVHGDRLEVETTPVNGHAHLTSLAAAHARRIEFVVEEDDVDVWEVLAQARPVEYWQPCALVPLSLLGVAHDRLRGCGYELQGWWVNGDVVAFGNVEIA